VLKKKKSEIVLCTCFYIRVSERLLLLIHQVTFWCDDDICFVLDQLETRVVMVFNATFQQYFSYIVAVSFIGGGNRSTCCKSL